MEHQRHLANAPVRGESNILPSWSSSASTGKRRLCHLPPYTSATCHCSIRKLDILCSLCSSIHTRSSSTGHSPNCSRNNNLHKACGSDTSTVSPNTPTVSPAVHQPVSMAFPRAVVSPVPSSFPSEISHQEAVWAGHLVLQIHQSTR